MKPQVLDPSDLLIASDAVLFAIENGFFEREESNLAWHIKHQLVEASKNLTVRKSLDFAPRIHLKMKRSRDLQPGDVVVGRVGGGFRIVVDVEILGGRERGHANINWLYEGGHRWAEGRDKVSATHYYFVAITEE